MKYKTREELLAEPRENLTVHEQVAQETLKENPDMTLEEAIELLEKLLLPQQVSSLIKIYHRYKFVQIWSGWINRENSREELHGI